MSRRREADWAQKYDTETSNGGKRKSEESSEVFKSSIKMLKSPPKAKESTGLEDLKNMMRELLFELKKREKSRKL